MGSLPNTTDRHAILERYRHVRATSIALCAPLAAEDYRIQSMPDVSPPWWNLGHTTWFFAKNVLEAFTGDNAMTPPLEYALNSYYESLGPRLPRHRRGLVTRPTTDEILAFRADVDARMVALIESAPNETIGKLTFLVTTGLQHEQQHQELLVTEIKHILGSNSTGYRQAYRPRAQDNYANPAGDLSFLPVDGGLVEIGNVEGGWCWDNEMPVHKAWLEPFAIADRLITVGEFLAFIADGGYENPLLWLSNGWTAVQERNWRAPMYWEEPNGEGGGLGGWRAWTLAGDREVDPDEPVEHVSFYEADAYVRWRAANDPGWRGARLPTEREWEHAARLLAVEVGDGNLLDDERFHSCTAEPAPGRLRQAFGDLWEWTQSHYEPYPGYAPFDDALMEYNGKFMDNQRVLRGGSYATPRSHIRASYRNFWPADTRFQLTGIRAVKPI